MKDRQCIKKKQIKKVRLKQSLAFFLRMLQTLKTDCVGKEEPGFSPSTQETIINEVREREKNKKQTVGDTIAEANQRAQTGGIFKLSILDDNFAGWDGRQDLPFVYESSSFVFNVNFLSTLEKATVFLSLNFKTCFVTVAFYTWIIQGKAIVILYFIKNTILFFH